MFKKTVLADTFSEYVKYGFNETDILSVIEAWLVSFSYTFQIYFDFSGYTDMALAIGKMFNFDLPQNFNSPYKATSVHMFWKRWHMTLSRFFKDYVYIPLGGSRCGNKKTYRNLWIVFLLTGIWHGASWMFVFWGIVHGIALSFNRVMNNVAVNIPKKLSVFFTFLFINFSWVFFRAESIGQAQKVIKAMFGSGAFLLPRIHGCNINFMPGSHIYEGMLLFMSIAFVLVFLCKNSMEVINRTVINSQKQLLIALGISSFLFMASIYKIVIVKYSEFIYFNF